MWNYIYIDSGVIDWDKYKKDLKSLCFLLFLCILKNKKKRVDEKSYNPAYQGAYPWECF